MLRKVMLVVVVAVSVLLLLTNSPTHAGWVNSETAGDGGLHPKFAEVFSPIDNDQWTKWDITKVETALKDQNYTVIEYLDTTGPTDNFPEPQKDSGIPGATLTNFVAMLQDESAILYVDSHGGISGLDGNVVVEAYKDSGPEHTAYLNYRSGGFKAAEIIETTFKYTDSNGATQTGFGIAMTGTGILDYYWNANTFVYINACSSYTLVDTLGFKNAREFFGYSGCPNSDEALQDVDLLWSRMDGTRDNADPDRAASQAYGKGGFTDGTSSSHAVFEYYHRTSIPTRDTVLSPAVEDTYPPVSPVMTYTVPTTVTGFVRFDTAMDASVSAASVITVDGCNAVITPSWSQTSPVFELDFKLDLKTEGTAILIVHNDKAISGTGFGNNLDGNLNPAGSNHQGPNRDDFVWTVNCVLPAPTNTPTPPAQPPHGGVGGVAEPPDIAGLPADTTNSGSTSHAGRDWAVGGSVAGILIVVASGTAWCARRRRLG